MLVYRRKLGRIVAEGTVRRINSAVLTMNCTAYVLVHLAIKPGLCLVELVRSEAPLGFHISEQLLFDSLSLLLQFYWSRLSHFRYPLWASSGGDMQVLTLGASEVELDYGLSEGVGAETSGDAKFLFPRLALSTNFGDSDDHQRNTSL